MDGWMDGNIVVRIQQYVIMEITMTGIFEYTACTPTLDLHINGIIVVILYKGFIL